MSSDPDIQVVIENALRDAYRARAGKAAPVAREAIAAWARDALEAEGLKGDVRVEGDAVKITVAVPLRTFTLDAVVERGEGAERTTTLHHVPKRRRWVPEDYAEDAWVISRFNRDFGVYGVDEDPGEHVEADPFLELLGVFPTLDEALAALNAHAPTRALLGRVVLPPSEAP